MAFYHDMKNKKIPPHKKTYGDEEGSRYRSTFSEAKSGKAVTTRPVRETGAGEERKHKMANHRTSNQTLQPLENRGKTRHLKYTIGGIYPRKMFRPSPSENQTVEKREKSFLDYEYHFSERKADEEYRNNGIEEHYVLTGRNPIREALKNNRDLEKLLVQKGELSGSAMEIVQKAKEKKVMIQTVEKSRLDEIAPQHQGLIAFASAYRYSSVEDILQYAQVKGEPPFILILDGLTDPHNLGAIIRTAECSGAHGVIVPQHRSVGLTPAAVKASAGAVEYVKVARVTNINRTIEDLKKKNIWVYALTMQGKNIDLVDFSNGIALVIGAEGDGISQLTQSKCDMAVSIPMKGHLDSLNASVAAGIVMYRVMTSRKE